MNELGNLNIARSVLIVLMIFACGHVVRGFAAQSVEPEATKPSAHPSTKIAPAAPGGNRSLPEPEEDLTSPALPPNHLRAARPLLVEKDEFADFTRELIRVQWRPLDPIDLYVIRPHGVEKPPVVIYLYSYPSETKRFQDNRYCQRLTSGGFAAVGFVSALNGHRYHDRPMREWFVSELQEALVSSVQDVQMVLDYLATRNDLDTARVGMFGQGSGASIAILAATVEPRLGAIDLLDPWGDWPDWLAQSPVVPDVERPNYLKPEFLNKIAALDPIQLLPKLASRPVRLQQVSDQITTPAICKQRLEEAAPTSVQIIRHVDTPHLYTASEDGKMFQWIKDHLIPQSSAKAGI